MNRAGYRPLVKGLVGLLACTALTTPVFAQEAEEDDTEIVVTGSLNALPLKDSYNFV